ncbi:MAG TPA: diaminopimelate decarboxylase [Candidatus Dormibacteraeota bacterium]|nr:diaminopimelate decarboxylase [Candidatus Dormibacteraeota bacterium]
MSQLEQLKFLGPEDISGAVEQWGTPVFVYDEATMQQQAQEALACDAPFGLVVRYAMKNNPNSNILRMFGGLGLAIDASSGFEADRALRAGIDPQDILITGQELPKNLAELVERGVQFNACSLHQLEEYGSQFPGTNVSVRVNPGLGSGHSNKTNVGGPAASFGIWYEYTEDIKKTATEYDLTIERLHTHIGSGSDPAVWMKVAQMSLDQVRAFPDVTTLNLGGGFKVARTQEEVATDLSEISSVAADALQTFYDETGRKIELEIEPGTFLMANAGSLITTIHDIVDTGDDGYTFIKIDSGMTEILRPALYGAQHPLVVVRDGSGNAEYIVAGHCCESGDILTPDPRDPSMLKTRLLKKANIGDLLVIEGVGAYCAAMRAADYNSFPRSPEVVKRIGGALVEIARRQTLEEMLQLETPAPELYR